MSMTTKPVMLKTIAAELLQNEAYFNIKDDDDNNIFYGKDFVTDLIELYYDWFFESWSGIGVYNTPFDWFKKIWDSYKSRNLDNWKKAASAYNIIYNPLDNYSREIETSYKNTRDLRHGKTTTSTTTDMTSETEYNSDTTDGVTTYETPVNLRNAVKSEHGGKDTTTINGTVEVVNTGTDTVTDTRLKADNKVSESGRNGLSMPDEIKKEIELRFTDDLADEIIKGFITKYLFLLPSEG